MANKKIKLSSEDYNRVLLTELQPYHIPIILDNQGFYRTIKGLGDLKNATPKSFQDTVFEQDFGKTYTIPFTYNISKNTTGLRELYLIHPFHQLEFVKFYRNFYSVILYNCTRSEFSLRYPKKISSTVYYKRGDSVFSLLREREVLNEIDRQAIDLDDDENTLEFANNFFSYRKYDFNYKFYESNEFLRLEKKFKFLKMLDVSRCFDSIYTHSIAWAIKGKEYIKDNLLKPKTTDKSFESNFDKLMQSVNFNETNGIVIGSEISRIFAELIFQRIDSNICKSLKEKHGFIHNKDYAIRRYVDDYCIFFSDRRKENEILAVLVEELSLYNFSLNDSKTKEYQRPFITSRSRNIAELRRYAKEKINEILVIHHTSNNKDSYFLPDANSLKKPYEQSARFIKDLKSYWHSNGDFETGFSGYLLNVLTVQLMKFIKGSQHIPSDIPNYENSVISFFLFISDVASYAFTIEPNVSNSITFAKIIIFIQKFVKGDERFSPYYQKINHAVKNTLIELLENELNTPRLYLVERINILLVLNDLDSKNLDALLLDKYIFGEKKDEINYFSLITGLFIVKNESKFSEIKSDILNQIKIKLNNLQSITKSSEAMHIYLDCMSCPFIKLEDKKEITMVVFKKLDITEDIDSKINDWVTFFSKHQWFITWRKIDILNYLRRKQLRESY